MNATLEKRPILAFTMGDVAGIGPEIIVRAWKDLCALCRPVIAGDGPILKRAMALLSLDGTALRSLESPLDAAGKPNQLDYCQVATADLRDMVPGRIGAAAGRAAHDFLVWAIDQAMARRVDGIVTAPLNKESLRAAGIQHPGHTEILADRTGTREFAMVKVAGTGEKRVEALRLADAFRARVIDAGTTSFIFEITGKSDKVEQFISLMVPLGLVEVARTGVAGITRGPEGMKE